MSQVKTSYSYDAPTDFINFTSLDDEEDTQNIDSWFGKCLLFQAILRGLVARFVLSTFQKNSRNFKKITKI